MNTHTVLIAEDNATNRELIREILQIRGFEVLEAGDGEEALTIARKTKPFAALIDIQMPRLNGLQLVQAVRHDTELCGIPMIALTAFAMRGDREKAIEQGFDGYVTKPINVPALLAEIDRCTAAREAESARSANTGRSYPCPSRF